MEVICPCCNHAFTPPRKDPDNIVDAILELWNKEAPKHCWVQSSTLADSTRKRLTEKLYEFPSIDDWKTIFNGLAISPQSNITRKRRPTLDLLLTGTRVHEMFNLGTTPITELATPDQVISIYNEYATKYGWRKVMKAGEMIRKKLLLACKELPESQQWHLVMKGLHADDFFSGRTSTYKPSIDTLIFKSRYITFYNTGLQEPVKQTVDEILDEFRKLLA